jgi:hypothetical protein
MISLLIQESWEDINEEKKDVEKPAEISKVKSKPKKNLSGKIEEREVCIIVKKMSFIQIITVKTK